MLLRRAAALSLLGSLVLTLPATAASPSPSPTQATFGIAPGTAGRADTRGLIHIVTGPGVVLHDEVVLQNASTFPITLDVYPSDAVSTSLGQFALSPANQAPTEAGAWLHIDPAHRRITLPARDAAGPSTAVVPVTITIPAHATPGDHTAGIVASLSSKVVAGKNQQITLLQRVGTRVYIRVSGQLSPHLTVDHLTASYVDNWNPIGEGKARVRFVLRNDGNVKLGAHVRVTVTGLWGPTRVVDLPTLSLLLPGASLPESVDVRGVLPSFFQHAHVRVDALAEAGDADPQVPPTTKTVSFLAIPWVLLACILALLLVWRLWRRWAARRVVGRHVKPGRPDSGSPEGAVTPSSASPELDPAGSPDEPTPDHGSEVEGTLPLEEQTPVATATGQPGDPLLVAPDVQLAEPATHQVAPETTPSLSLSPAPVPAAPHSAPQPEPTPHVAPAPHPAPAFAPEESSL